MFGMKAVLARIERIEGSLLWIARELGGKQGLAALSRELASQKARGAELAEALNAQRRELEAQRRELEAQRRELEAQRREFAQLAEASLDRITEAVASQGRELSEEIGKANASLDRITEAVASQGRELSEEIGGANAALDRVTEAVASQGRELSESVGKANEALARLQELVAQIESAPALREELERMRLEAEALGEHGLRMVDLLTRTQDELQTVKNKNKQQSRKKKS